MANDIDDALAQVKKIVGNKYKEPKLDSQVKELSSLDGEFSKAMAPFKAAISSLEKAMLALQNNNSKYSNQAKQLGNSIAKATFGLDKDDKDDKKKIDDCQKILSNVVQKIQKTCDTGNKQLDEVDKHIDDISGYKGPGG